MPELSAKPPLSGGTAVGGRNPAWNRDETILLLDLFLRVRDANQRHPEVLELSRLLNAAGAAAGALPTNYRNAAGVSRKLRYMAQNDPAFAASGRRELRNGNRWDGEVWRALADDPVQLAHEVARIRADLIPGRNRSRGPVPSFGTMTVGRADGETMVYVLKLEGATAALMPDLATAPDLAALKFGRTSDLTRRLEELNLGFPPGSAVRWRAKYSLCFPDAFAGHAAEQRLLASAAARGWTIGGEFAIAPLDDALALAEELAQADLTGH